MAERKYCGTIFTTDRGYLSVYSLPTLVKNVLECESEKLFLFEDPQSEYYPLISGAKDVDEAVDMLIDDKEGHIYYHFDEIADDFYGGDRREARKAIHLDLLEHMREVT